jgi:hypothetical protein
MVSRFKVGDIVEVFCQAQHDAYNIGDIGTIMRDNYPKSLSIFNTINYVVRFNIRYTGSFPSEYERPTGEVVYDKEIRLANYVKSPLWRLMNET